MIKEAKDIIDQRVINKDNLGKGFKALIKYRSNGELTDYENSLLVIGGGLEVPTEVTRHFIAKNTMSIKELVGSIPVSEYKGSVPTDNIDSVYELGEIIDDEYVGEGELNFVGSSYNLKNKIFFATVNKSLVTLAGEDLTNYIMRAYNRRATVTENKLAISELMNNKKVQSITDIEALKSKIKTLKPSARVNTVIITNEAGLNELDITDSNGVPLIIKENGKLIFDKKYEVIAVDHDMGTGTDKIPFIVGDIESVIKFIVKENINIDITHKLSMNKNHFRIVAPMDCVSATKSDKYYFVAEM